MNFKWGIRVTLSSVDPVPSGLLLLLPIHMAKTPTSMCMPLRTLNDSLSHRRRYMVRPLQKAHEMLQWSFLVKCIVLVLLCVQTCSNHWLQWQYKSNPKKLHFKLYYISGTVWKNFTSLLDTFTDPQEKFATKINVPNWNASRKFQSNSVFRPYIFANNNQYSLNCNPASYCFLCLGLWLIYVHDIYSDWYLSACVFFYLQKHNFPINYTIRVHSYEVFKLSNVSRMVNITSVILSRCTCYDTIICPFQWMSEESSFSNQSLQVENLTLQRLWFQVNQGILKKVRKVELTSN